MPANHDFDDEYDDTEPIDDAEPIDDTVEESERPGGSGQSRPDQSRLFAALVLIKEQPCHGYELAERLADLGVDARLGQSLYRVLRDMEGQGLVTSAWDLSRHGGPPRRVYTITPSGDDFLADATPGLLAQRSALGAMLARYRELTPAPAPDEPRRRTRPLLGPDTTS